MIPDYKKEMYRLWSEHDVATFPKPSEESVRVKSRRYRDFFIKRFFPAQKDIAILDLGSGWGIFLKSCLDEGYANVFGVEVAEKFVQFSQEQMGVKNVVCGEIQSFLESAVDESFDIITAFDVMEHFTKSEIMGVLTLIRKKLKKNGRFIMQVPNGGSLSGLYIFNSDLTHEIAFTDYLVKELFQLAGFAKTGIFKEPDKNIFKKIIRKLAGYLLAFTNEFAFTTDLVAVGYASTTQDHALLGGSQGAFDDFFKKSDPWNLEKDEAEKTRYHITLQAIEKLPLAKNHVLELGCAEGNFTKHLSSSGYMVDAVDISQTAIARAKNLDLGNVDFYASPAAYFIKNHDIKKYGLVLLMETLYYLDSHDKHVFMETLSQKIDPTAFLVVSMPMNSHDPFFFSPKNLVEFMGKYGFLPVVSRVVSVKGFANIPMYKKVIPMALRGAYLAIVGNINKNRINQQLFIFKKS
ncbi:MAG: hypothetical protein A3C50_03570 [Candidatus Staskawiczbacteria bacterium RIFCSPHIGHO2_02_FULL_43_16]|uniref:Uncharacterized protein n=1 Tax=Candidatus Staskawiczbacteria bacterium RIFCSPHIGHO2_01_FULL_41_41 TaxID=1802203 RepID=A0A1G2HSH3_9BACT|nr:MAG: hypothetical protein A2822_02675 [Candidatus Staskawiczbacteria bacterium RIFCSPHIGHO2_01_FULL_41_41]OGZ68017.1 MAG: hypothetical protein A3C50_03570 [Candidatus Staskawiczbacteria bacterium RIFCSPHIGHO2_02_FULL_43_16]OGZ74582.1 MAG: hypothetical protein A3A12_02370 [Candidatus Staskawiczbacteria bacterium RIFCSPLOWO2_01_FULL_43_17b]